MIPRVAITYPGNRKPFVNFLLIDYLSLFDCEVDQIPTLKKNNSIENNIKHIEKYDHIFIYSGSKTQFIPIRKAAESIGIGVTYFDPGGIPSSHSNFFDRKGILGDSSLCEDISWVDQSHINALERWKEEYFGSSFLRLLENNKSRKSNEQYIFCPLQVPHDCNLQKEWSPFFGPDCMLQFIKYIQREYPDFVCIFKCHPYDMVNYPRYKKVIEGKNHLVGDSFLDLSPKENHENTALMISYAGRVIGVNSTVLLESIMFGVPTTALGKGYVYSCKNEQDKIRMASAVHYRSANKSFLERSLKMLDEIHQDAVWQK